MQLMESMHVRLSRVLLLDNCLTMVAMLQTLFSLNYYGLKHSNLELEELTLSTYLQQPLTSILVSGKSTTLMS